MNKVKVDLCCGRNKHEGYIGVDYQRFLGVDIVADLTKTFPFEDNSVDEIIMRDGLEHLPDKIHSMNELYRILKPGGVVTLIVPSTNGMGAFQDPTHVSYWNLNSFQYYTKGILRDQYPDLIKAKFEILQNVEVRSMENVWINAVLRKPDGDS